MSVSSMFLAGMLVAASGLVAGDSPVKRHSPSGYVLGPDDQVSIQALHLPEISDKPMRIDMAGNVRIPLAGVVHAGGMTVEQFETALLGRLKTVVQDPEVTVSVVEYRSQPVSVLGAVKTPGIYQVQGRKTLLEMLSLSGGLDQEAGDSVRITRQKEWGSIPLPGAHPDPTAQFSVAELNLKNLMQAKNPAENIPVFPNDVITVPRASLVYVIGDVHKPGGFTLRDHESVSVLQALSMSEGLLRTAGAKNARILRPVPGSQQRQEIPVNLASILDGRSRDVRLQPDDILFVPNSAPKSAFYRGLQAAVEMGTGVVVWRRF